jgi:hypothetical protein
VKRPPGTPDPALARADAPTLALSTVQLDAARLRQLLVFERTLRSLAPAACPPEQTARAHAAAITASGLKAADVEAPLALLRRYAANRSLRAQFAERVGSLLNRAAQDDTTREKVGELQRRLGELDQALRAREDVATQRLLEAHSSEILALFAGSFPKA